VLCQEGWQGACDPNGWGNANYDPQQGVNGPSFVFIDTFTVAGDGTIVYQLTPKSHEDQDFPQIFANTANLGGTLVAQFLPGFYADHTFYNDLIEATNPLNGTFAKVIDNSILLDTKVIYDQAEHSVDLEVDRVAFNAVNGLTKNEKAVGGGIENVFGKLPGPNVNPATTNSFDQLVANLFTIDNAKSYQLILDQLSGAQFAQMLQSVLWSGRPFDQAITDRMDCTVNRVYGNVPQTAGTSWGSGCVTPDQWQAWARAWGGWNHDDGDRNAPGFNENQFGIWGGGDYAFDQAWFLGLAGGYFQSNSMDFARFGGVNGGTIK